MLAKNESGGDMPIWNNFVRRQIGSRYRPPAEAYSLLDEKANKRVKKQTEDSKMDKK